MSQPGNYYFISANLAKAYIPGIYNFSQDFIKSGLFAPAKPDVAEATCDLVNEIQQQSGKTYFRLTFSQCALLYGIMTKVKIAWQAIQPKVENDTTENITSEKQNLLLQTMADLQQFIDNTIDAFCNTFPEFIPEVERFRNDLYEAKLSDKKIEADNTNLIVDIDISDEFNLRFQQLIFSSFFILIVKSDYQISRQVREADFFSLSAFQEVSNKLATAIQEGTITLSCTLRDLIVIYMVNNVAPKLYFTDAGDEFMQMFNDIDIPQAVAFSAIEMRNRFLQVASGINECIEQTPKDEKVFAKYIDPVKAISV